MNDNIENKKDFLRLIHDPLVMSGVEKIYKQHGVVYERVDLYRNFTLSLNSLIQSTYMGDDIHDEKTKKQHFDWCWKQVSEDFTIEGIYFVDNQMLYEYFRVFMLKTFYIIPNKDESLIPANIEKVFSYLFDYNHLKKADDIETFIDVYKKFELSFKNK